MKHANVYGSKKTLIATFMLSALAAGCGGGGGGRGPILGTGGDLVFAIPVNSIPPGAACPVAGASIPTVTLTDPADLNQNAPTSTTGVAGGGKAVTATFSQAMNPATINAATFSLAQTGGAALIPASVTYDALSRVATLKTSSALAVNTNYTAVIQSGATSATGTPIGCPYVWTFKTGATAEAAPAAVNLGRASSFGIASAAGMTNVIRAPNTRINGNAVLYPLTTCNTVPVDTAGGFGICGGAAPSISGQVYSTLFAPAGGPTAAQIMTDLRAAYDSITKANLPNATVLGCGIIGSMGGGGALPGCAGNSTLAPGVYISATNSSIGVTGVLTLDGQGDPNARFIFQMPSSTLTTAVGAPGAPGSEIKLINGAKASNVFWQVGSSATINKYSVFNGSVLADTTITIDTGATSCGRLLAGAVTVTGAITLDSNVVSVPGTSSAPAGCV